MSQATDLLADLSGSFVVRSGLPAQQGVPMPHTLPIPPRRSMMPRATLSPLPSIPSGSTATRRVRVPVLARLCCSRRASFLISSNAPAFHRPNISEAVGRRGGRDKARFYAIARVSAMSARPSSTSPPARSSLRTGLSPRRLLVASVHMLTKRHSPQRAALRQRTARARARPF